MDNEITEFNAKFDKEIKEIAIITQTRPFSGAKSGTDKFYEVIMGITAWKFITGKEIFTGEYSLTVKADSEGIKSLREKILPDTIISLKVRQKGNYFLLVEIFENKTIDEELEKILKEQTKQIIYKDDTLGRFILDKRFDIYTKKIEWDNKNVELNIEKYKGKRLSDAFITANEFIREQIMWDQKVKKFAANKLLKLKNEEWLEENEKEITLEQFVERINVENINIFSRKRFEIYFDDGDIFWGHEIIVSGNLEKGPIRVEIEG
jgi:hypothetical protein